MTPVIITIEDIDTVDLLLTTCGTIQEIANELRKSEKDAEIRAFYANLKAYCIIIRDYLKRINKTVFEMSNKLISRILDQLSSAVTADIAPPGKSACSFSASTRLSVLNQRWDEIQRQTDGSARLQHVRSCTNFGTAPEERNDFIQSLAAYEEELRMLYPEDPSQWTADSVIHQKIIREPSYAVWNAAQTMFKALVACKNCQCTPTHEFGARLCLGTYRKPNLGDNVETDDELDFDMFLSMQQDWHEVHVHMAKETVVQFSINAETEQLQAKKREPRFRPMKVKRLCEPITKIKSMAAHRLEFKVMRGQLFKLRSERIIPLVDQKSPISLKQFLKSGPRSFTEKTKRILAVILSYSVLHLHDTPWLQPTWGSSNVFFFRTLTSAIPLRPFIQAQISDLDHQHVSKPSRGLKHIPTHGEVDDIDSDDVEWGDDDPDDSIPHHCPALVTLAVMLMEVYFVTPFNDLAKKYGVDLGQDMESAARDANFVFQECRGEIPENSQFHYAIEMCLDPTTWEDEYGNKLDNKSLRTRIYQEVVRPLETELSQAYSSISIDELDQFAQRLDLASWDQTIQTWNPQTQAEGSGENAYDYRQAYSNPPTRSASPFCPQNLPALPTHCQPSAALCWGDHLVAAPCVEPTFNTTHPRSNDIDYKASRFFDDETISEAHTLKARLSYSNWKSKYLEVYTKFISEYLDQSRSSPVKIAILDTGIDVTHSDVEVRLENIKDKYNWVNKNLSTAIHDRNGHGTFTAGLILDYAPDAELYIAKIADSKPSSPSIIAKAINHAVSTWKVDIISMSFGFPTCDIEGYGELENSLTNAHANNVLLFAAASNSGGKLGRAFPAREPTVIAIHATDTNGNRSEFSPTAVGDDINLATVGEAVESAWPVHLCDEDANLCIKYKSGTSYATPIAAGIAGFLLLYARLHLPEKASALKSQKRMKMLLKRVAEKGGGQKLRDDYHFVDLSLYTDSLFGKDKKFINLTIQDILRNC